MSAVAETTQADPSGQSTASVGDKTSSSGVSQPWASDWIKSDFSLNHAALERLPDHLKDLRPTLERQQNLEGILIDYKHSKSLAGQKGLTPLLPGSPPEVVAKRKEFLDQANGVPKTWQEYGIQKPKDLKDDVWDPKMAEGFAQWAHKWSVPPQAAQELVGLNVETAKSRLTSNEQAVSQYWANEKKLFEETARRENIALEKANSLVDKGAVALGLNLDDPTTKTFLQGANARLMAMRHAIAIGEDSSATPTSDLPTEGRDYAEMAKDIRSNPANPLNGAYWNKGNKFSRTDHDAAVAKVNEYLRLATEQEQRKRR